MLVLPGPGLITVPQAPFTAVADGLLWVPSWVLSAGSQYASVDMDFANARYWNGTSALTDPTSLITTTRNLAAYAQNSNGTLTLFGANVPRIGTGTGLLVEESRQNICLQSQTFDSASWTASAATVVADQAIAPDGTLTADQVYPASSGGFLRGLLQAVTKAASALQYSVTYYVRANNWTWVAIQAGDGTNDVTQWFNVATGATGSNAVGGTATFQSASASAMANGYYRLTLNMTSGATTTIRSILGFADADGSFTVTASGTNGVYLWGSQIEPGAFPTSYIPTTTAAVTRPADLIVCAGVLASVLNGAHSALMQTNQTLQPVGSGQNMVMIGQNGTDTGYYINSSNTTTVISLVGGVTLTATLGSGSTRTLTKTAAASNASGRSLVANNGAVVSDANVITYSVPRLGVFNGTNSWLDGYMPRLTLWNSRLADASLQALTA